MAELIKVNAPVRKPLFEGVQGENEARSIQFDITPWVAELGDGVVTATAKRSQDSQPYPVTVTKVGNIVTWKPTSTDTAFAGVGSFQLEYTVDSVLAKTCIWSTMVAPSLDPAGDPPDPYDNWLAEMRQIAADALQDAQDADASAQDAEAWAKGTKNGTPVPSTADQYQNNSKYFAEESYKNAEAWAVGQRGGVDVPSTDPTYHNNSKYWAEQSAENQYGAYIVKSASGDIASFSDGADDIPMKSLNVTITPKQSGSGDPSPSNVRPITGWTTVNVIVSPTTTASDGTTTPVPLGQTVYGGTVNPISGELVIDWAKKTVTSTDDIKEYPGAETEYCFAKDAFVGATMPSTDYFNPDIRTANILKSVPNIAASGTPFGSFSFSTANSGRNIYIKFPTGITSRADFVALLAQTPLEIAYKLATATTVQLTPAQVATLLGTNNVWSDAGSVEVEYRADPTLAYNELANVIVSLGGNL